MILHWRTVLKAPSDVKIVPIDWTGVLEGDVSAVTAHSAQTAPDDDNADMVEGEVPAGSAGVVAADVGMVGYVQSVSLSAGTPDAYSLIACTITLADGTSLTRGFQVNVR